MECQYVFKILEVEYVIFGRANKRNRPYAASGIFSRLQIEKEIGKEKARKP